MRTQNFEVTVASFIGKGAIRKEKITLAARDKGDARDKVVGLVRYQIPIRNKRGRCYATAIKSMHTWPFLEPTGEKRCIIECKKIG